MLDGDLVRVDLLRIKRLLFTSYPEGSKAQRDFLTASKISELGYLSRLVPPDIADLVFEEYRKVIKCELIEFAACLGVGFCLSLVLFSFHQAHPNIVWLKWFSFPFGFGAYFAGKHAWHMIIEWRKIQPFKKEHKELKKRMDKLSKEIKDSI